MPVVRSRGQPRVHADRRGARSTHTQWHGRELGEPRLCAPVLVSAGTQWQTLVDLAESAIELSGPGTREYWRERILSVKSGSVEALVAAAPELSEITRCFTVELVMVNRGRLLDVLC